MKTNSVVNEVCVKNEIGTLKKVLIHSPDSGIGEVVPSKAQDWLYEDIVDIEKMRREYDIFRQTLLAFIDPDTLLKILSKDEESNDRQHKDPANNSYIASDKVIDVQYLLSEVLQDKTVRNQIVTAICAVENLDNKIQTDLLDENKFDTYALSKVLITGYIKVKGKNEQIFPPVPNLIFTRDIGIIIGDYIILSKPAKAARIRESLLVKYVALHSIFKNNPNKVIEISQDKDFFLTSDNDELRKNNVTVEGGDIMMIAKGHLLIGCSERTSANAVDKIITRLFDIKNRSNENLINKVTVIVIPNSRDTMHIDTIFTQVSRSKWVLYGPLGKNKSRKAEKIYRNNFFDDLEMIKEKTEDLKIYQFENKCKGDTKPHVISDLETLFEKISVEDFKVNSEDVKFIYSGNGEYPYDEREQWTDSCNVLAVKEGVVIGYDRNYKTTEAFEKAGVKKVFADDILDKIKEGLVKNKSIEDVLNEEIEGDTIILIPSSELSRARGGSHCMSMPLLRDEL